MNNKKNLIILLSLVVVVGIILSFYFLMNKKGQNVQKNSDVDFSGVLMVDEKGTTTFNNKNLKDSLSLLDEATISDLEKAGLTYMREEEKLAHDVYTVLFQKFSQVTFDNIAKSELTHTDAVKSLLDRYNLEDPSLDKKVGEFVNVDLKKMYVDLLNKGTKTIKDALEVGAAIEEIDILDLQERLAQTDNEDIQVVYENLMRGSRNHLRAFTKNYKNLTGQDYVSQYLSKSDYDAIVGADIERGGVGAGRGKK